MMEEILKFIGRSKSCDEWLEELMGRQHLTY